MTDAPRPRTLKAARAMATNASALLKGEDVTPDEVLEAAGLYRSAADLIAPPTPRPTTRSVQGATLDDARAGILDAAESGQLAAGHPVLPEATSPGATS